MYLHLMITVSITVAHVHFAKLTEGSGHFFLGYLQRPHGVLVCVCVGNV